MIKFPYGISDFHRIRIDGYGYLDRSALLHQLQQPERLCCLAVVAIGFERLVWRLTNQV